MHEYFAEFLKLDEAQFQIRWKTWKSCEYSFLASDLKEISKQLWL